MSEGTRGFKLPKAGWKGQLTTYDAYNVDLAFLEDFLKDRGLTLPGMTENHWHEYVEYRKQGPKLSFGYSAHGRALSAARRYLAHIGIPRGEHPIWDVEWPQGSRKIPRTLRESQKDKLLEVVKAMRHPLRDRALIELMWDIGGRRFELAEALWENIDLGQRTIWLLTKSDGRVGNQWRPREWELKRFGPKTAEALKEWKAMQGPGEPRILGLKKNGISSLFKRLSKKAGFKVSPHDFRRGLISRMKEKHVSDSLGMQLVGIKTHSIYDEYGAGARLQALDGILW